MLERRTKKQWIVAWIAFKKLITDPSQTKQFFVIINALSGPSLARGFQRFLATEHGVKVIKQKRDLIDTLKNFEYLKTLPTNSLGYHYFEFVEAENLKAQDILSLIHISEPTRPY